jgi:hypothetical protein
VYSRLLAEHRLEIGRRQLVRVERPEPQLDLQRAGERCLHRHLLVEGEPDQQSKRLACEQRVRVLVRREVEFCGDDEMLLRANHSAHSVAESLVDELHRVSEELVLGWHEAERPHGLQRFLDHHELVECELKLMHHLRR